MDRTYDTIKRNFEAKMGKPEYECTAGITHAAYELAKAINDTFTLSDHLRLFETLGKTIEINDGVVCI